MEIERKLSLSVTEDEAMLLSAGLYALEFWFELIDGGRWQKNPDDVDNDVKAFSDAMESVRNSLQDKFLGVGLTLPSVKYALTLKGDPPSLKTAAERRE